MYPLESIAVTFHYYIYYQVDKAQVPAAAERVQALLREVQSRTGVRGRVVRRRDDPLLWMEIYENIERPAEFEQALAHAVASTDVGRILAATARRKTECFVTPAADQERTHA